MKGIKYTKEKFIEEVRKNNFYFKNQHFFIIGDYINTKTKILVKNKYGTGKMFPTHLLQGANMTIKAALDKHTYFLNVLYEVNESFRNKEFIILNKYINNVKHLVLKTKYGYCKMQPSNLLSGSSPSISSAIYPHFYYIQILENKNKAYKKRKFKIISNYTRQNDLLIIISNHTEHGVLANNLIMNCIFTKDSAIDKKLYYINKFKQKTKFNYDYSKFKVLDADKYATITCSIHGDFYKRIKDIWESPDCPECTKNVVNTFSFSGWNNSCPGNPGIFYILKCYDDKETFIKIGITCNSIKERYRQNFPYLYEELFIYTDFNRKLIWDLEKKLKRIYKNQRIIPNKSFFGNKTECFPINMLDMLLKTTNPII